MPEPTVTIELTVEDTHTLRDLVMKELARNIRAITEAYERVTYMEGEQGKQHAVAKAESLVFELLGSPFGSLKARIDRAIGIAEPASSHFEDQTLVSDSEKETSSADSQEESESQATRW